VRMQQQPTQTQATHHAGCATTYTSGGGGGEQVHALAKMDAMWMVAKHALWHDDQERLKIRRKDTLYIYAPHARIHLHMIGGNVNMFNVRACCMCMHVSYASRQQGPACCLHTTHAFVTQKRTLCNVRFFTTFVFE